MSVLRRIRARIPSLSVLSLQARRVSILAALLFIGGCFATFQACSPSEDPVASSSQTQALQQNSDPAGNRGGIGRTGEYIDNYLTVAQVESSTFKRVTNNYHVDGPIYAQPPQPLIVPNVPISTGRSSHRDALDRRGLRSGFCVMSTTFAST